MILEAWQAEWMFWILVVESFTFNILIHFKHMNNEVKYYNILCFAIQFHLEEQPSSCSKHSAGYRLSQILQEINFFGFLNFQSYYNDNQSRQLIRFHRIKKRD